MKNPRKSCSPNMKMKIKMSDHIPFEIQIEIIKRISIKSLLRFRSVSNSWKTSIDSSKFNADYTLCHAQRHEHVLIRYNDQAYDRKKYFSIIHNDDSCFPPLKPLSAPRSAKRLDNSVLVGSSHGLLCLFGYYSKKRESVYHSRAVIWNPSIKKSVAIETPDVISNHFKDGRIVGFGVCPDTIDPKIVKVDDLRRQKETEFVTSNFWQVKVSPLTSGVWRSKLKLNHVPSESIGFISPYHTVVIDRFIYWIATGDGLSMILSFNLTSEEFKIIYLPEKLAANTYFKLSIFKLRESLVVVECKGKFKKQVYTAWMMENGSSKSFSMLFTVSLPSNRFRRGVGFRSNGQFIMETRHHRNDDSDDDEYDSDDEEEDDEDDDDYFYNNYDDDGDYNDGDDDELVVLVAYEPGAKGRENLKIYGENGTFFMRSYKESLLLLNQK